MRSETATPERAVRCAVMTPLHGIGGRQDLPLPFEYVLAGAGIVLVATFVLLIVAWVRPRWEDGDGIPLPRLTRFVDHRIVLAAGRTVALAAFAWAGFALVAGQDRLTNPVFGVVYVWMWVGLVPVALLFGPVWAALNPLRTIASVGGLVGGPVRSRRPRADWARIGIWPGALGLAGFAWLELVQPGNTTLAVLRGWAIAWLVVTLGGALVLGRRWIEAADPFEVYSTLVSRLSPWQRIDGIVHLVNPLRNAASLRPAAGTAAVVCILLGSTAFDSFGATTWWVKLVQASDTPHWVWGSAGLAAWIVFVAVTLRLGCLALGPDATRRIAPSLIPLVVGYAIGHYLSLLVIEGQRTAIQWSDPLGQGWNAFGTAELGIDTWLFDHPAVTAVIQAASIVGGHVAGIVIAHDLAIRTPGVRIARQIPLLTVMVGYTIGGLVLLFSP